MSGIEASLGLPPLDLSAALRGPFNPFVGPRPIERGQPIFGRDREIDELYYLLSAERIVLFHSPSGAGKSSLLQAGLLPRLQAQFDVWAPVRVSLQPEGGAGSGEISGVNRYVRSCVLGFEAEVPANLQRPAEAIAKMTLAEYVASRPRRKSAPKNIVLIFDQFEEILTVDPVSTEAKHEFFDQLGQLLKDPHIWAIFALREDYLAPFDPYAHLVPTNFKNRFRLDLLGRDAASEAIEKTAQLSGRSFTPAALQRLVEDLSMMLVQQPDGEFKRAPGPYIEPMHLQVVCLNLWWRMEPDRKVIEESDIVAFGDVSVALGEYYATEVGKISNRSVPTERDIRLWFGEKLIRRGKVRGSVLREQGQSGSLSNELIESLIKSHLVRPEQRAGATWYELAHDRLIEPVLRDNETWFAERLTKLQLRALQWEREDEPAALLFVGKDLIEAEIWKRQQTSQGRNLSTAELRFIEASRQKRRRKRQGQAALAILVCLVFVISGLWYMAMRDRKRAEMNLSLAKQAVDQSLSSAGRQQAREAQDSPDIEAFRKELLSKAATFYSAFIHYNSGSEELRAESASAHSRLGDIDRLLDKSDDAVKEYKLAIAEFEKLARDKPKNVAYRQSLAYCHNWLGETLRQQYGQQSTPDKTLAAQASAEYNSALELQQKIHDDAANNAQYTQELARTHYNRGILEFYLGDRKNAEIDLRIAVGLLGPLVGQVVTLDPQQTSPSAAQDLARTNNDLAALDVAMGNTGEAISLFDRAIGIGEQLTAANPDSREYKYELALYDDNEARLLMNTGNEIMAADRNHDALDLIEQLSAPSSSIGLEEAKILQLRSQILMQQGSADALEESEHERELLDQLQSGGLSQKHPLFHVIYANLANNYVELAKSELQSGDLADAQLSLKSLALVIPELAPEDKTDAQQNYDYYEQMLKNRQGHHK